MQITSIHTLFVAIIFVPGLIAPVSAEISRCPVNGPVRFVNDYNKCRGGKNCSRHHQGIDLFADLSTEVVAVGDGTIIKAGRSGRGGISLWLQTDDGVAYYYAHNQENLVTVDARVTAGQLIARVGDTGNATAPHLHFEKHAGGLGAPAINPYSQLVQACLKPALPPRPSLVAHFFRSFKNFVSSRSYGN